MRDDGRKADQLRPVDITLGFQAFAEGSALITWGMTRVICAASVEESVPRWREESGSGWVTAEYAMLPRSTNTRKSRGQGGREREIQRLIGRSLRAAVNMKALGPRTITVDCDVLQADGGTRVASITGGYVALVLALQGLVRQGVLPELPLAWPVAAVSVGVVDGVAVLDLPYPEDNRAEVDMNMVMTAQGRFVELQGTAEHGTYDRARLNALCDLGWKGIQELLALQAKVLDGAAS